MTTDVQTTDYVMILDYMLEMELPHTELLVYAVITGYCRMQDGCFFGSQEKLAKRLHKSRNMISTAITSLSKKGLLRTENNEVKQRVEYYAIMPKKGVNPLTLQNTNVNTLTQGQSSVNVLTPPQDKCQPIDTVGQQECQCIDKDSQPIDTSSQWIDSKCQSIDKPRQCIDTYNKYILNNKININTSESEARTRNAPLKSTQPLKPAKKLVFAEYTTVEPPTVEQVKEFVEENGLNVNAEHFHKHYSLSGWCDKNGRRIEFWQQKLYTWHELESKNPQGAKPVDVKTRQSKAFVNWVKDIANDKGKNDEH